MVPAYLTRNLLRLAESSVLFAQLLEQAHVVAARPVLDDHPIYHAPDVDKPPRRRTTRNGRVGEQRHRGGPVGPVQREVLRYEVTFTDEVVLLDGDRPKVVVDGAQDALEAVAALGTSRVVHHIGRYEIIERRVVTRLLTTDHLLDDLLRTALTHDANLHRDGPTRVTTMRYAGTAKHPYLTTKP